MSQVRDFLADDLGDLAIVNGDFATVADAAAVPQGIACRVGLFRGEYWLDESEGVPWLDEILGRNRDPLVVRALITDAIATTPDVTEVVGAALELDGATRLASIRYTVTTAYSTTVSGEIAAP